MLDGAPVRGVLGVPVVLGPEGWTRVLLDEPADDEARRLSAVVGRIGAAVSAWTGAGAPEPGAGTTPEPALAAGPGPEPATETDPAAGDPDDTRWTAQVVAEHRTGTVAALAAVFSTRGVNFDALSTTYATGSSGTIEIEFRADERRCRALERTIARLAVVRAVEVRRVG